MEQFGLPKPIIRLISRYVFDFASDDIVAELLNYHEALLSNTSFSEHVKSITPNIVFYTLSEFSVTPNMDVIWHINRNAHELFMQLIPHYDSTKIQILRGLIRSLYRNTICVTYRYKYLCLNLLDSITIQACKKRKNVLFLSDLLTITNSQNSFKFRCNANGTKILDANTCPDTCIAMRDIAEYFARIDDTDSLNLVCTLSGTVNSIDTFVLWVCENYIRGGNLPKLAEYRKTWLEEYYRKITDGQPRVSRSLNESPHS